MNWAHWTILISFIVRAIGSVHVHGKPRPEWMNRPENWYVSRVVDAMSLVILYYAGALPWHP